MGVAGSSISTGNIDRPRTGPSMDRPSHARRGACVLAASTQLAPSSSTSNPQSVAIFRRPARSSMPSARKLMSRRLEHELAGPGDERLGHSHLRNADRPPCRARWHRAGWRALLASRTAVDLTHLAAMNTAMMDTRCVAGDRRFVVEAGNTDPATQHQVEHDELVDRELHTCRTTANRAARSFLQRGLWVEVYDDETKELLAGPFDPDQPAPSYIV